MIATTQGGVKARQKPPGLALNLCVLRTYFAALGGMRDSQEKTMVRRKVLEAESNQRRYEPDRQSMPKLIRCSCGHWTLTVIQVTYTVPLQNSLQRRIKDFYDTSSSHKSQQSRAGFLDRGLSHENTISHWKRA